MSHIRNADFKNVVSVTIDEKKQGSAFNYMSEVPFEFGIQDEGVDYPYKRCFLGNKGMKGVVERRDIVRIYIKLSNDAEFEYKELDDFFAQDACRKCGTKIAGGGYCENCYMELFTVPAGENDG